MTKPKKPSKAEATSIIYGKIISRFNVACIESGRIATLNYIPKDIDIGTLKLAIQPNAADLFVKSQHGKSELLLSDYINYCNELNNTYENFGFNELTIA